jgi:hypothetical protein
MMSSRQNEIAYTLNSSGIFSSHFFEALADYEESDANGDFLITAEELYETTQAGVVAHTTELYENFEITNIQHPLITDRYEGELALLYHFMIDSNLELPSGEPIFTLDGQVYKTLPYSFIWAPGSLHLIALVESVEIGNGVRFGFAGWEDGQTSPNRQVSQAGILTANFQEEYRLIINSELGDIGDIYWYEKDSTVLLDVTDIERINRRDTFTGWSGDISGNTSEIILDTPKEITANWRTEYLLTIISPIGQPEGGGWYEVGSVIELPKPPSEGIFVRQVFDSWGGEINGNSILVDGPKSVTAIWRTDYTWLLIVVLGSIIVIGLVVLAIRNRS